MRYDVVLLDLDGTITDPYEGISGSYRHALASVGYPVPDHDDLRWAIGPGIRQNIDRLGVPPERTEEVVKAYRERHVQVGLYQATLIPGMATLLAQLAEAGCRLALATAKTPEQGVETLRYFDLRQHFTVIGGAPNGFGSKGEIISEVLKELGSPDPSRTIMVGDRDHDVIGAHENGLEAVGVRWGFAGPGELEAAKTEHIVDSATQLGQLIMG
jgi:phosphoglycolate phosphatase